MQCFFFFFLGEVIEISLIKWDNLAHRKCTRQSPTDYKLVIIQWGKTERKENGGHHYEKHTSNPQPSKKKRVFEFWKTKPYAPTPQKLCWDVIVEPSKCEHYDVNPISLFT